MRGTQSIRVDKQIITEISQFAKEVGLPNVTVIKRAWEYYKEGRDYTRMLLYPRKEKNEELYEELYND